MYGICSSGGYVPRYRLSRESMYRAMGWYNATNIAYASGEKAVANFDEDSITMAVAAVRDMLPKSENRSTIDGVYFASTSMPYAERLNASIITTALGLKENVRAADFAGGRKAGSTALLAALDAVAGGNLERALVCSSDCRPGLPASPQEFLYGDGAAALLIGRENVIAEFKGFYSSTHDFVDRYRGSKSTYDKQWEDRWIRDMGYAPILSEAVGGLLNKYGLKINDFAHVAYDCHYSAVRKTLNKKLGISKGVEVSNFQDVIGHCGAAQPLMMLVEALEKAKPGDKILVVSFGGGCDALYFEVTDKIKSAENLNSFSKRLKKREPLDSYMKYLVWRNILPTDAGLRAEEDAWTRWSVLWRKRKEILGLWGAKCTKCGMPHYPVQRICPNPECGSVDTIEPYCFADRTGSIVSYTGDNMAPSEDPPAMYGHIAFEGGGKYVFDFTECKLSELSVGVKMSMSFRRKYYDNKRDISGYYWKAVMCEEVAK
jgi:hydroxymethylglutaryl-CoA synthase